MNSWLWALVPNEATILVVVGIAVAVMFGFMKRGQIGMVLVGLVVLPILVAPFFESLFASLPAWVSLVTLLVFGMLIARAVLQLCIGRRAADHVVGELTTRLILGVFHLFALPFKMVAAALRSRGGLR